MNDMMKVEELSSGMCLAQLFNTAGKIVLSERFLKE